MPDDKKKKKRSSSKPARKPRQGGGRKANAPATPAEPTLKSGGGPVRKRP
jgi:hypothetical protein